MRLAIKSGLALQPRQASLTNAVARLLVENYESEARASAQVLQIYDRVQRQVYFFLAATLAAILATGLYLIHSNRRLFERLASLSRQRSELARQLIATQESTLRHISRELHDEFGQTLTAVGALLSRAEKQMPDGSVVREELREVRDIAQHTLENVRSLSQSLHPVMLDETGLGEHRRLVPPDDRETDRHHGALRKIGRFIPDRWRRWNSYLSNFAGGAEQHRSAFRLARSMGSPALSC